MKKILFVYPPFSDNGFWNYKVVCGLMGAKYPAAPLGLITVAGLLPKEWEMKLVDMNAEPLSDQDIEWADLVFIGGMLPQQKNMLSLIDRVHSLGKKTVLGGPDPSSQPEIYAKSDYLVLGEAEKTIWPFLKDLENGVEKGIYQNAEKPAMCETPVPRYDLLNLNHYLMIGVQFSRGCPFNCEFCDIIELYGRVPRTKSPDQVIKELDFLYELGYRGHVDFVDDNFIGNKKDGKAILIRLKEWSKAHNYPFFYSTEASINLADDDELLKLMQELDFRYVFVGIESPNPEILKSTQKFQNVNRKLEEDLDKIYRHGIVVNAGLIVGFDGETSESAKTILEIVEKGKIAMAMVGLLYALPNTQLTRRLQKEGRIFDNTTQVKELSEVDQTTTGINFVPTRSRVEIKKDFLYLIKHIYDDKIYFNRIKRLGKALRVKPSQKRGIKGILKSARAFFRLIGKMGLFSKRALYFWRNIFLFLFTKPSSLETAVNLMAMHLHFKEQSKYITKTITQEIQNLEEFGEENFNAKMLGK
ncbi:MAG TPA: B12-binding domain-containing radical SAM protein [Spirochaetia bacterium]|nr:MAG: hypothetical protein A2Y41_13395 [Spirochaetes bacterium GWB1_36_13]HCL55631.1 B12-binding domain-containing radical SAM protein [Spirochaetia bacterium]